MGWFKGMARKEVGERSICLALPLPILGCCMVLCVCFEDLNRESPTSDSYIGSLTHSTRLQL